MDLRRTGTNKPSRAKFKKLSKFAKVEIVFSWFVCCR